jgi:hypothetical protein
MTKRLFAMLLLSVCAFETSAQAPYPAPRSLGAVETYGRNIQRTMRLLATSTPQCRHTVRILFYGQSITEQSWSKLVSADLRRHFPHADLVIENRATGGHSSPGRTTHTDAEPRSTGGAIAGVHARLRADGVVFAEPRFVIDRTLPA